MKKGKSLRQTARQLQISPAYLSMILSGQRQPNPQLRDKLCSQGLLTNKAKLCLEGRNSTTELLPRNCIYFTSNIVVGKQDTMSLNKKSGGWTFPVPCCILKARD